MLSKEMTRVERITAPGGARVSFERYGEGPPLVLVHGMFSDHRTNWQESRGLLESRFAVHAVARRGRGETDAAGGYAVTDEAADIAAVLCSIGEPAALLGHSYGALCALEAAALVPGRVRALVLYEPPYPENLSPAAVAELRAFGERGDWDGLVEAFMRDVLQIPPAEVAEIRASPFWDVWTADAPATLNDMLAVVGHRFDPERFRALGVPTLLLAGSESPREIYLTDALAGVLPDVRIAELAGQGHEGMTTAPDLFVDSVTRFLANAAPGA